MKRAALGALLISLVAGSTAFAGTALRPDLNDHDHRRHVSDHRDHRNDRRHDRDNSHWDGRRNDHRGDRGRDDDRRWHDGRRDDHRGDRGRDNDRRWHDGRRDDHRWNHDRRHDHRWDGRRYDRRWERGRWHWGSYHRPHGYVHRHWGRGDRLPHAYYASHYVIRDYHDCGLRRPPRGYHWVRVNNDAVLALIATGVILDVAYNQFW